MKSQELPEHNPAFEWKASRDISGLDVRIDTFRHKATGAEHYHLSADHPESAFLVAFRTQPQDSTGVAHILEHTVLCGSQRYPVRDPFFLMTRRSLNSYMNALTSSDWTAYPFASCNQKDFYNLMDVYLDSVFFPLLDPLDFAQEGHRLELDDEDGKQVLQRQGVVFNEMKGALSNSNSYLWQKLRHHLFPTTTYHYSSGGNPEQIPELTYQGLKEFHQSHYHPGNAIFMTFGKEPITEIQSKINDQALKHFPAAAAVHGKLEQRFDKPQIAKESFPASDDEKGHVLVSWLLGESTDLELSMKMQLLAGVLLDNSASPLMNFLESHSLGDAPSPLCGLEDSSREMSFVCGLEGIDAADAAAFEAELLALLNQLATDGVDQQLVDNLLHQVELQVRETGGDSMPYGLQLMMSSMSAAIHGGDPADLLDLQAALDHLRKEVKDPQFIPSLIQQHLLDNPHRLRLDVVPDAQMRSQEQQQETDQMQQLLQNMTEQEKQHIQQQSEALQERQAEDGDVSCLPSVGRQDISAEQPYPQPDKNSNGFIGFAAGTNGLVYQQLISPMPKLDQQSLAALPYYSACLGELGIAGTDYLDLQKQLFSHCGGLYCWTKSGAQADNLDHASGYMVVAAKSLSENVQLTQELLLNVRNTTRFDELPRLQELMTQMRVRREQSLNSSGHMYAMSAAAANFSSTARLNHLWHGLGSLQPLRDICDSLDGDQQWQQKFQQMHQKISDQPFGHLQISHDASEFAPIAGASDQFDQSKLDLSMLQPVEAKAWLINSSVSYCAKVYRGVASAHPDAPALTILAQVMKNGFLHGAIREQGGAYGGGANHNGWQGSFSFYSYRDPRLQETLDDFDRSIDWVLTQPISQQMLDEAVLSVISQLDRPGSPAGECKQSFSGELFGRRAAHRSRFRHGILNVTAEALKTVAAKYLKPEQGIVSIVTGEAVYQASGLEYSSQKVL
ncbi:insulinase family protein [Pelagibaculum spongiae]|uniref:Peptidase M16 n=1 Tax=Pelagibaculum spongiae TaxID=2080658 RepID=A0A2V1GPR2_9GAMM|nr:insulinase family protein [Pelagibaculum spongiae]PVZ64949.1 peptidase M16 [Pelagibaculum spongiae]